MKPSDRREVLKTLAIALLFLFLITILVILIRFAPPPNPDSMPHEILYFGPW